MEKNKTLTKITNAEIMKQAREALSGKWGLAIGTFVVYAIIIIAVSSIHGVAGTLSIQLVSGPFALGTTLFSLAIARNQSPHLDQIFMGFKRFSTSLLTYLWIGLFTLLWSLLFLIPGLVASLGYSMTYFIIADDPAIGVRDAVKKSKKIMYGYKWKLFRMDMRFLGWALLCIPTLGIGFLWLIPYMQVSMAKFYESIKNTEDFVASVAIPVSSLVII